MKYQYYIASRWRNRDAVLELAKKLREKGKAVYCFAESDTTDYALYDAEREHTPEGWMEYLENTPDWQSNKDLKEILEVDLEALNQSESLILLLPAGKSSHIDAGIGFGLGKKCIVVGGQEKAEVSYMIFGEFYDSIDDFISQLK